MGQEYNYVALLAIQPNFLLVIEDLQFSSGWECAQVESDLHLSRDGRDALEVEAEAILRRLEAEEEAEKARKDLMIQLEEQHKLR